VDVGLIAAIVAAVWVALCGACVGAVWLASRERSGASRGMLLEVGDEFLRLTARAQRLLPVAITDRGGAPSPLDAMDEFLSVRSDAAVLAARIPTVFGASSAVAMRADDVMQALTAYGRRWGTLVRDAGTDPARPLDPGAMLDLRGLADQLAASSAAFATAVWEAVDGPIAPQAAPRHARDPMHGGIFQLLRHPIHRAGRDE
jgi:hypothetical protein